MARGLNQPEPECQLLSLVVAASESPAQAELSVSESESVTVAPEGPGVAVGPGGPACQPQRPEAGRWQSGNAADSRVTNFSGRPGNLSRLISAATWGAVPRWHEIQPRIISRAQRRVSGRRARPDPERSLRLAAAAA